MKLGGALGLALLAFLAFLVAGSLPGDAPAPADVTAAPAAPTATKPEGPRFGDAAELPVIKPRPTRTPAPVVAAAPAPRVAPAGTAAPVVTAAPPAATSPPAPAPAPAPPAPTAAPPRRTATPAPTGNGFDDGGQPNGFDFDGDS